MIISRCRHGFKNRGSFETMGFLGPEIERRELENRYYHSTLKA